MTSAVAAPRSTSMPPAADPFNDVPPVGDFFTLRCYTTKRIPFALPDGGILEQPVDALDAAATDFDMTGQIVWQISRATAAYLAHVGQRELAGRRVLELGAGAGLVGLVASHWAREVVLSDNEGEVLSLLSRNLAHVPPTCRASVVELDWGNEQQHAELRAAGLAPFPVIVGADIVFWSSAIAPLIASVAALLERAPEAVFILGYCNRVESMRTRLLEEAARAGLDWIIVGWDWLGAEEVEYTGLNNMALYRFSWRQVKQ